MVLVNESTVVPNDTYPRFFWCVPTTSTNQRSFSHTRVGVLVSMVFVNESNVVLFDHKTGFFWYWSSTLTNQWPLSYSVKCKIYADMILRFQQSDFHVTAEIFFGPYIYIVRGGVRRYIAFFTRILAESF